MAGAWPEVELSKEGSIGWRAEITNRRGKFSRSGRIEIEVFGTWFALLDRDSILPVEQEDARCLAREHSEFQFCRTVQWGVHVSDD